MSDTPIIDAVRAYLKNDEWPFEEMENLTGIRSGFQGEHGTWTCVARTHEDDSQLLFYSVLQNEVPEAYRAPVAEFLTRANYGMRIGNFEMDFSDGEGRYKTSIDIEGGVVSTPMLRNLIGLNVSTMNRYFLGISKVMYGGATPADAIAEIEG